MFICVHLWLKGSAFSISPLLQRDITLADNPGKARRLAFQMRREVFGAPASGHHRIAIKHRAHIFHLQRLADRGATQVGDERSEPQRSLVTYR